MGEHDNVLIKLKRLMWLFSLDVVLLINAIEVHFRKYIRKMIFYMCTSKCNDQLTLLRLFMRHLKKSSNVD